MQPAYRALPRWVFGVLAAALAVVGFLPVLVRPALPDVSWPLYLAARVLEGAELGRDYVEVNPPLIVWLSLPPVLLGRLLAVDPYPVLVVGIALLASGSLATAWRLLDRPVIEDQRTRQLLFLAMVFATLVLPRRDFSEREHLTLLLTLPWVLLAARRAAGGTSAAAGAAAVGVAAALGFALKPYFLIAWLLVEVWLVRRAGWKLLGRPESVVLVAVGACYLAAVLLLVPAWLPMALELRPLYGIYLDNGLALTILLGKGGPLPMLALLVAAAQGRRDRGEVPLRTVLVLATLGFLMAAIIQQKGWRYHYVAAMGYGLMLLASAAIRARLQPWSWRPSRLLEAGGRLALAVGIAVTLGATLRELADPDHPRYREDPALDIVLPVVRREAAGQPIMVFSSNPASGWPLTAMAGATWASKYMSLWLMAAIYHDQIWRGDGRVSFNVPAQQGPIEQAFHEAVVTDFARYSPALLVVLELDHTIRWGGATQLDYLAYFSTDPGFAALLARYQDIGRYGHYRLYRLRS